MRCEGTVVSYGGHSVHSSITIPVRSGDRVVVKALGVRKPLLGGILQGLHFEPTKCQLDLRCHVGGRAWIWLDSKGKEGFATVDKAKEGSAVCIWNVWGQPEYRQSARGNYGMLIEDLSEAGRPRFVLRCSDGPGPPDFSTLVAELTVERATEN